MNKNEISIRTTLKSGDLGYIIFRHAKLYAKEYGYGLNYEAYVAAGIAEFYSTYNANLDRVWICEANNQIIGSLFLMHRENKAAQLRFFYLEGEYRGLGLGKNLMTAFMEYLKETNYNTAYLWTTEEQIAAASLYIHHGFELTELKESSAFGKPLVEQRYDLILA